MPTDMTVDRILSSRGTEITPANGYVRLTVPGGAFGDPSIQLKMPESSKTPQYMVIKYRTTAECQGECFICSDLQNFDGIGDRLLWDWNSGGEWETVLLDLTSLTDLTEGVAIFRLDYLSLSSGVPEGEVFDLSYVALFETAEGAEAFREAFP